MQLRVAGGGMHQVYEPWSGSVQGMHLQMPYLPYRNAFAIFSLASGSFAPLSYALGRYSNTSFCCLEGKSVCVIRRHNRYICLNRMCHNIDTGCTCQSFWLSSSCYLHLQLPYSEEAHNLQLAILHLSRHL